MPQFWVKQRQSVGWSKLSITSLLTLNFALLTLAAPVQAGLIDDLRARITDRSTQIQQLDQEINQFRAQLTKTQTEKRGLEAEFSQLDSTAKKLTSDLTRAERTLKQTDQLVASLGTEISTKQQTIEKRRAAISAALRTLREADDVSLIEVFVEKVKITDILNDTHNIDVAQQVLFQEISALRNDTMTLAEKKRVEEQALVTLAKTKEEIGDKKQLVDLNKNQTANLLSTTKNQEAAYQAQLADRLARKQQAEAELKSIEEQIRVTINPNSLPQAGTKALIWPLANVRITQYFGNTDFATKNPQVYSGRGHNGIDLGAPVGTALLSAATGVVKGIGDTDTACRGASYGKWILIEHNNGLSTLYAHLSMIKVSEGQSVTAGELIGYTGNTGYSTGPHLHFTVYASQGVEVGSLQSKVPGCGVYRLPIAAHNSYLNPLTYLP